MGITFAICACFLVGVDAGPTAPPPEVTKSDLRRVSSDPRVTSSDLRVTSADLGRDQVELRQLLRERPDLRSVLEEERHETSEDLDNVFNKNIEEITVRPEEIENILELIEQSVDSDVGDELDLGALSSSHFFSSLFSKGDGLSNVTNKDIDNVSVIAPHVSDGTRLDSLRQVVSESHLAASAQTKTNTFAFVEKRNQFLRPPIKHIRARTYFLSYSGPPASQSGSKAETNVRGLVNSKLDGKSQLRDNNRFLTGKNSDVNVHAGTHKNHFNRPTTKDAVVRNYIVNGIQNNAILYSSRESDIVEERTKKNNILSEIDVSVRHKVAHGVQNSSSIRNHSDGSARVHVEDNGFPEEKPLDVIRHTENPMLPLTAARTDKNHDFQIFLDYEEEEEEFTRKDNLRQVQNTEAEENPVADPEPNRPTALDTSVDSQSEAVALLEDSIARHKLPQDSSSTGSITDSSTGLGSMLQEAKKLGSQIHGTETKEFQLRRDGQGSELQHKDIPRPRSQELILDSGSHLQEVPASQVIDTTGPGSKLQDTDETGSKLQNTDETGSKLQDADEPGSKLQDADEPGSKVQDADESGSKVQDADEPGSKLLDIDESGSKLQDIDEPGYKPQDTDETGPKLQNTEKLRSVQQDTSELRSIQRDINEPGSQPRDINEPESKQQDINEIGSRQHATDEPESQLKQDLTDEPGSNQQDTDEPGPQLQINDEPVPREQDINQPRSSQQASDEPGSGQQAPYEPGSKLRDASGSRSEDILEPESQFPGILGRGGDLLKGIVVYTIDPFAGRRRGKFTNAATPCHPACHSTKSACFLVSNVKFKYCKPKTGCTRTSHSHSTEHMATVLAYM